MDPAAAAGLLEDLADRALASEFEPAVCLEAPEPAEVPRSLVRADGRSVYQRHGGTRYATRAQLVMEERMLAQARASGTPRMGRAQAARALGADLAQLDAALAGRADATPDTRTRTGLRTDQAAAALSALTDGRRVSVINAARPLNRALRSTTELREASERLDSAEANRSCRGEPAHSAWPRPDPLRRQLGPGHLTSPPDPARRLPAKASPAASRPPPGPAAAARASGPAGSVITLYRLTRNSQIQQAPSWSGWSRG
jgi:hypothetical protein